MQKNQFLFILSLIFAVIVCLFALTNSTQVVINLFFYKFEGSLALVIFLSAMLGALVLGLLGIARFIRFRLEISRLTKEKDLLFKEKEALTKEKEVLAAKIEVLAAKIEELKTPPAEPSPTSPL